MNSPLPCTENIIGITQETCECFTADLEIVDGDPPAPDDIWYQQSDSGLFLDELDGIESMWSAKESLTCDQELSAFYIKGRNTAIIKTQDEVLKQINDRFVKQDRSFIGSLGAKAFTKGVDITADEFYGIYLKMRAIVDGVMILNSVDTMFEETATFDVTIYRRYIQSNAYELVDTITGVNSTANRYVKNALTTPMILPMYDTVDGELEYFFVYDHNYTDGDNNSQPLTPKNNMPTCGGCGRVEGKAAMYVTKYGVHGTDITNLSNWSKTSSYAYGLSLQVEFRCDADSLICRMFETLNEWKQQFAYAVLLKAGIIVHQNIIRSPEVSRAQMIDRDGVIAQMTIWEADYNTRLTWLAQNVNPNVNDCYMCNDRNLKVSPILL